MKFYDEVKSKIMKIATESEKDAQELIAEFVSIYNRQGISDNPNFFDEEERQNYVAGMLNNKYNKIQNRDEQIVIPLGITQARPSKAGTMIDFFAYFPDIESKKPVRHFLLFKEDINIVTGLIPKNKYAALIFRDNTGNLRIDNRTTFTNNGSFEGSISKTLFQAGIKKITLNEVNENLSSVMSSGYSDKTDWRMIRARVQRFYKGARKDGKGDTAMYTLEDDTLGSEPGVSASGQVIETGFTAFVNPDVEPTYKANDLCDFFGTIEKRTSNDGVERVTMNAYLVEPVHIYSV